jgi:Na+/proline symporter
MLVEAGKQYPVEGNLDGSYLTFYSKTGLIFMIINLIGNFATVFNDQAYWQRAIASQPSTAVKAYIIGGSAWLSIRALPSPSFILLFSPLLFRLFLSRPPPQYRSFQLTFSLLYPCRSLGYGVLLRSLSRASSFLVFALVAFAVPFFLRFD